MTMTKRFVFDPSIYHFTDTKTGKTYCEYNLDKVVDILNEQDKDFHCDGASRKRGNSHEIPLLVQTEPEL